MTEDFHDIQAGDDVIVESGGLKSFLAVRKVDRTTKTQIIIGSERYRKTDGRLIGHDNPWSRCYLQRATPERVEGARKQAKARNALGALDRLMRDHKKLSEEVYDQILAAYRRYKEQSNVSQ